MLARARRFLLDRPEGFPPAVLLLAAAFLAAGSAGAGEAPAPAASPELHITYPLPETLFPPDIVAPTFLWEDGSEAKKWRVVVRSPEGDELASAVVGERRWRPSREEWERIKKATLERDGELVVRREAPGPDRPVEARVRFRTSKDPVADAILYREVPLPFLKAVRDPSKIRWRFGTVDSESGPPVVLHDLPVCGNCHSFSDDGTTLGLDVDYGNDKGAYAVLPVSKHMELNDEKIITWADYRRSDNEPTFGLLSRVSPTGRYVISTVKDRSVFVAMPDLWFSQLFFPIKGILVVYDRETERFFALPGADDPRYVQTNPVWSPDGKEIVFARAPAYPLGKLRDVTSVLLDPGEVPEFTVEKRPYRYDLYRIPFNDGKGGTPEPVRGASGNGKSNFFPKFSPDGKWIVFCQADSYMLLQPDSELYIIPAAGGEARRLRYNTPRMNSWHSWSSNSRWLVFSSKANTPYTQLFLTHIDEEGNDSPPVLLERFTAPDRAANIPEFVRLPGDAIAEIRENFLDPYSFLRAGMVNERTGDYEGAVRLYRRGVELAPDDPELRNALGFALFQLGRTAEAVEQYERGLAAHPEHVKLHNNLALALIDLGRLEEAAHHYEESLRLEPSAEIHSDLGFVLARLGLAEAAMSHYRKALELDPHCASAHANLGATYAAAGRFEEAARHYREAVAARPTAAAYNGLGYVLARLGRTEEAIAAYRRATELDGRFVPAWNNLGQALERKGQFAEAARCYRKSLELKPSPAVRRALARVERRMAATAP